MARKDRGAEPKGIRVRKTGLKTQDCRSNYTGTMKINQKALVLHLHFTIESSRSILLLNPKAVQSSSNRCTCLPHPCYEYRMKASCIIEVHLTTKAFRRGFGFLCITNTWHGRVNVVCAALPDLLPLASHNRTKFCKSHCHLLPPLPSTRPQNTSALSDTSRRCSPEWKQAPICKFKWKPNDFFARLLPHIRIPSVI